MAASRRASVALIFASAYGNTSALAQALARGATKAGVGVESINCEFASVDEARAALRYAAPACLSALAAVRRPCPGPGCPASLPGPTARSGRRARAIRADRCWRWCAGRTAS